jgi:hypothetical protein
MMAKPQDLKNTYDDPMLSSVDFLLSVMRDRTVPIETRMDAAEKLMPIYKEIKTVCIKIIGGMKELTAEQKADIEARNCNVFDWRDQPKEVH